MNATTPSTPPAFAPSLAHCGVFVRDLDAMARFYREVFDMQETDRGEGRTFRRTIAFLSSRADQHHQLALATGRGADAPSTVMQLSFKVQTLEHLREARRRALARGATQMRGLNHGNAISIYFRDPEGNRLEVFFDTPWYCTQPLRVPVDLEQADDALLAQSEAIARKQPDFVPRAQWVESMRARMRRD